MSQIKHEAGPHIHNQDSIRRIMLTIALAMLPPAAAAVWLFGLRALLVIIITAAASLLFEMPFSRSGISLRNPFGDGSALVAGLILGLSLPPTTPLWIAVAGALLLVTIGKQVFGGLGNNIFNPALVSRAILILTWPQHITGWVMPFDSTTSATPLAGLDTNYLRLAVGTVPGSLGETSALALLISALILLSFRLINWRIPVSVLAGGVIGALLFNVDPLFTILSGSLLFGAVFMATDMTTSPTGKTSHIVFGFGCGLLTVFIRVFTSYPEGITFAFLIMNGLAYLMDRAGADPIFGEVNQRIRKVTRIAAAAAAAIAAAAVIFAGLTIADRIQQQRADAELSLAVRRSFPAASRILEAESFDPAADWYRIYENRQPLGFFASTTQHGYGGLIAVDVVLDLEETIVSAMVRHHTESPTIGSNITGKSFLTQFSGFTPASRETISESVDSIAGATISSRAVVSAVHNILAARDKSTRKAAAAEQLPVSDDGSYIGIGIGSGYHGPIEVEVTVAGGRITNISVRQHNETTGIGTRAIASLGNAVIEAQTLSVDAISGATGTSNGFLAAVRNALKNQP